MFGLKLPFLFLVVTTVLGLYDHYLLPETLKPQHYDLKILTHLNDTAKHFEGLVKIDLLVLQTTKNITLHAKNLTIDDTRIYVKSSKQNNCIENIEVNEKYEFYIMHLCKELKVGENYQLEMPFKGLLNESQTGYYKSSYNDTNNKTHYLAVTQFSPTFARLAFPCFDEPNWKATFNVTLGYHRDYMGLSNTPLRKCENHEFINDYIWCSYEQLIETSTYLVAYAVHNLTNAGTMPSNTQNQVIFQNWLQPKLINQSDFSIEIAPKILNYLEELFQLSFPLKKIDQFISPTHKFRAMENWGLVTYKENAFTYNPDFDWEEKKERNANTMAHEFSHQWFGNLVTMKWWNDLWLKEGPSTYFAYLTLDALHPEWDWSEKRIANDLSYFFNLDATNITRPISRDVRTSTEIIDQFSRYVYEKGSLTIRMLHKILGNDIFFIGIRNYLKRYSYGNVNQNDLWNSFHENILLAENIHLNTVMDSWTLQMGYPLITVKRDYNNGTAKINQKRFLLDNNKKFQEQCWWVPLTFVNQNEPNFEETAPKFWLECPSTETNLNIGNLDKWLILNPQVYAIYRVNYDQKNWKMIINTLKNDENFGGISRLNRIQLMDDLTALAAVGEQNYDLVFELYEYLKREVDYLPCERGIKIIQRYGNLLKGQEADEFKIYMKQLLTPHYRRLPKFLTINSTNIPVKEIAFHRFIYTQACLYNVDDCVSQVLKLNTNDSSIFVPANYRQLVYCMAIENGNNWDFQHMMELLKNVTIPEQQIDFASGLGCTRNYSQLNEFLDYAIHANIKTISNCYLQAVTTALKRYNIVTETRRHIFDHAELLNKRFRKKHLDPLLMHMLKDIKNVEELKQLEEHFKDLKEFKEPVRKTIEITQNNLLWLNERAADFNRFLSKYIYR